MQLLVSLPLRIYRTIYSEAEQRQCNSNPWAPLSDGRRPSDSGIAPWIRVDQSSRVGIRFVARVLVSLMSTIMVARRHAEADCEKRLLVKAASSLTSQSSILAPFSWFTIVSIGCLFSGIVPEPNDNARVEGGKDDEGNSYSEKVIGWAIYASGCDHNHLEKLSGHLLCAKTYVRTAELKTEAIIRRTR